MVYAMLIVPPIPFESLEDLITRGSFYPQTFHIKLNTPFVSDLDLLPQDMKRTYSHEFGHLLHYFTSYIGLIDLSYWAKSIAVLETDQGVRSPEEQSTFIANSLLRLAHDKQRYNIDDEYYYEPRRWEFSYAKANSALWKWQETSAQLFKIDGTLSHDHWFWAIRFYIGHPSFGRTFIRIPVGIRTILEHVAKAIDFEGECFYRNQYEVAIEFAKQSSNPELLHYFCLTHYVSTMLEKKHGLSEIWRAFPIAGQIILLMSMIPFDEPMIWTSFINYANKTRKDIASLMNAPHPSIIFPLLVDAAGSSATSLIGNSLDNIQDRFESILEYIGLPTYPELAKYSCLLGDKIFDGLDTTIGGKVIARLGRWIRDYKEQLSLAEFISQPACHLGNLSPTPVAFNDTKKLDGSIIQVKDALNLLSYGKRKDEMLRYPIIRDIIP
jgi:hypothetical protein